MLDSLFLRCYNLENTGGCDLSGGNNMKKKVDATCDEASLSLKYNAGCNTCVLLRTYSRRDYQRSEVILRCMCSTWKAGWVEIEPVPRLLLGNSALGASQIPGIVAAFLSFSYSSFTTNND